MWRSRVIGPLIPVKSRITRGSVRSYVHLSHLPRLLPLSTRFLSTPALFLSRPCLPVEPNPAPRSRVQRRSLHRSVINHRRVGLTRLHAREPARARRELLSSPFFFFLSLSLFFLHFVTRRRKKGADGAKKSDEKLRKAVIVVPKFIRSFPLACFDSVSCLFSSEKLSFIIVVIYPLVRKQVTLLLCYHNMCLAFI